MAIRIFWMYIGVFFACSIFTVVLVKKFSEGFAEGGKKPYIYGSFFALMASLAAYFSTLISSNLFTVFWILGAIFLVFGAVHMVLTHKKYFYAYKHNSQRVLIGEFLFGLSIVLFTVVVFSALQYFVLKDKDFLFFPVLMSSLLFFVPFLVYHTFEAAYSIPPARFPTWQYPLNNPIEVPDDNPREKILVIGFEIAKKPTDRKKSYFRAKAPETMKLGDLYYHFINDYNDLHSETTIEFTDNDSEACEWWFRRKPRWYQGQQILDPELSIRENHIKENTVIICERINSMNQS